MFVRMIKPIHLLIADDHSIIRHGLRSLIEKSFPEILIAEASSSVGVLEQLAKHNFTHAILDMQLSDSNILDIFNKIQEEFIGLNVMIYTMNPDEMFAARFLKMGVYAYVNKDVEEYELKKILSLFFANIKYLSKEQTIMLETVKQEKNSENPFNNLSDRELSVLQYLIKGLRVKEIATKMDIKITTVATFKARLFEKLHVSNIIELQQLYNLYKFQIPSDNNFL